MGRRKLALEALELPPHGHPEQDSLSTRRANAHHVLFPGAYRCLHPAFQRYQVLKVPKLARQVAQDEETAWSSHAFFGLPPCECHIHITYMQYYM